MVWDMVDATKRWLAARSKVRGLHDGSPMGPRSMAPWDENAFFQVVKETVFTAATLTQLALADPMRVAIIFSLAGGAAAVIATSANLAGTSGLALSSSTPILSITQAQYGNLCQSEFWAVPGPGITITVIEMRLRDWPP